MVRVLKKHWAVSFLFAGILLAATTTVQAIPALQLDSSNGVYNASVESTAAASDIFTIAALLQGTPDPSGSYFVDVVLYPKDTTPASLGSFVFGGTTVNVTADMTSGNPGLPPHGVYDSFYKEFAFTFNLSNTIDGYDVSIEPNPHPGPLAHLDASGTSLYNLFNVDLSGLAESTEVWFDFYHKNADGSVDAKAPFSHDVFTVGIPEPSTMVLVGFSLLSMVGLMRRRRG